jgi:hypothetical protein
MTTIRKAVIGLAIAAVCLLRPPLHAQQPSPEGVEVSVSTVGGPEFTLHSPVVAEFRVVNRSASPVQVDAGWDRVGNFTFTLLNPLGRQTVGRPQSSGVGGIHRGFTFTLAKGASESAWTVLDEWLDFSSVGTYELTARFVGQVRSVSGELLDVQRNWQWKITIKPRDVTALERTCADLARRTRSVNAAEQLRASRILSFVKDPVAVRYLQEVASADRGAGVAIQGLERIGGTEAREALQLLSKHTNRDIAAMAADALRRVK